MLTGNVPPEPMTCRSSRRSPTTANTDSGVAARVDRVQQVVPASYCQRALRGQVVDDRSVENTAESVGRVGPGELQRTVGRAVVGDDRVARDVVGLDEHRTSRFSRRPARSAPGPRAGTVARPMSGLGASEPADDRNAAARHGGSRAQIRAPIDRHPIDRHRTRPPVRQSGTGPRRSEVSMRRCRSLFSLDAPCSGMSLPRLSPSSARPVTSFPDGAYETGLAYAIVSL